MAMHTPKMRTKYPFRTTMSGYIRSPDTPAVLLKCYSSTCTSEGPCLSPTCPFQVMAKGLGTLGVTNNLCSECGSPHPDPRNYLRNLEPSLYSPIDLAAILQDNNAKWISCKLHPRQTEFIWDENISNRVANDLDLDEFGKLMNDWFAVLDTGYFFGSIRNRIKPIRVYTMATIPEEIHGKGRYGWSDPSNDTINIVFTGQRTYLEYVGTLLHEMLHAFFQLFACRASLKCQIFLGSKAGIGHGHGKLWAETMFSIESAFGRDFPNSLNCGMKRSVIGEMIATGWNPSAEQQTAWGIEDPLPFPIQGLRR